jgi:hypothetical protein
MSRERGFQELERKTKMISLVRKTTQLNMENSCNYISYIDQLNLYFYSYARVLWFLRISKTQILMALKFHAFIQRRQMRNTGIYLYNHYLFIYLIQRWRYPRPCNMELIVSNKFVDIWKKAVIHNPGPILKLTWWCREKDRKCIHMVTLRTVRNLQPENFLRCT